MNQDLLLQQYGERIEKLSQQDKLSKFCMDAGFPNVVEIGQYFRTKDTADLFQEKKKHHNRKAGSKETPKVATSYLHGKYGVEIRIMSLNRDNTHSWVRISHISNKVCDEFEKQ